MTWGEEKKKKIKKSRDLYLNSQIGTIRDGTKRQEADRVQEKKKERVKFNVPVSNIPRKHFVWEIS